MLRAGSKGEATPTVCARTAYGWCANAIARCWPRSATACWIPRRSCAAATSSRWTRTRRSACRLRSINRGSKACVSRAPPRRRGCSPSPTPRPQPLRPSVPPETFRIIGDAILEHELDVADVRVCCDGLPCRTRVGLLALSNGSDRTIVEESRAVRRGDRNRLHRAESGGHEQLEPALIVGTPTHWKETRCWRGRRDSSMLASRKAQP